MKNKLQALIAEQKALTAKFEELLNSNTEESPTLDPHKVYIKGHPTRGAEVIKMLEDLGGVNNAYLKGQRNYAVYYITPKGHISMIQFNEAMADYTELHLPEVVSEENAQTTDIKVGDFVQITKHGYVGNIKNRATKSPVKVIETHINKLVTTTAKGEMVVIRLDLGDKFHKVDPPTEEVTDKNVGEIEEVELIEGEVYANGNGSIFIYCPQCRIGVSENLVIPSLVGMTDVLDLYEYDKKTPKGFESYGLVKATPEQRKQLFDALEKAGKHFDKENMRLLDVEKWSKEHRDYPVICRHDNNMSWSVKIMCEYVKGKALVRTKSAQKQWMSQVIPYNDQTKHLIGTTNSPDKHYRFVE